MTSYGTLTSVTNNTKEVFSTTTGNGTSNSTLSGVFTVTITCDWTDRGTYTSALNSAYPSDSAFIATTVERTQKPGGLCEIVTTYTSPATTLPDTTYAEQSSQVEVDIREHPNFSDWADDWDDENERFNLTSTKAGIKSYIKGTTTVTVTSYYNSMPSDDRANIGKIQTPGGSYSGTNSWLLVGANRSKQGPIWVMSKTYLYSAKDWDTDIYS
jgi:hypothetical protein